MSNVYQSVAFSLTSFPRRLAEELCAGGPVTTDTQTCITWRWEDGHWHHMHSILSNLMAMQGEACAGQSKGLKTESEFVCRVIATIITPLEISWVSMARGVDQLYINILYALESWTTQRGAAPPQGRQTDRDRADAHAADADQAAGPLGRRGDGRPGPPDGSRLPAPDGAYAAGNGRAGDAHTAGGTSVPPPTQKGKRHSMKPLYDVAEIVDEKGTGANHSYLVRWAGYHPSWEAWRLADWQGQPGDP
eukprot:7202281-Prymnesium_polylepis.1